MDLDYSAQGGLSVRMKKYAANNIKELPEDMMASVVMPAVNYLFNAGKR